MQSPPLDPLALRHAGLALFPLARELAATTAHFTSGIRFRGFVGRAVKANMLLIVECRHCYHASRFKANDVAKVVGWNKPL
ncbi:MAG: hypothetical protein E5W43_32860, partial [Mesorhizobium sp.]